MSMKRKNTPKKHRKRYKPGSYMDLYMAVGRYVEAEGGCVVLASGINTIRWPSDSPGAFTIGVRCTGRPPSYDTTQTNLALSKTGGPAMSAPARKARKEGGKR